MDGKGLKTKFNPKGLKTKLNPIILYLHLYNYTIVLKLCAYDDCTMSSILFEVHTRLSNIIGQFVTRKLLEGCYDNKVMEVIIHYYTVRPPRSKAFSLLLRRVHR